MHPMSDDTPPTDPPVTPPAPPADPPAPPADPPTPPAPPADPPTPPPGSPEIDYDRIIKGVSDTVTAPLTAVQRTLEERGHGGTKRGSNWFRRLFLG